jgi:hypothetical protein
MKYNELLGPQQSKIGCMRPSVHFSNIDMENITNVFIRHNTTALNSLNHIKLCINSVAFRPQANYTDRATAACRRS